MKKGHTDTQSLPECKPLKYVFSDFFHPPNQAKAIGPDLALQNGMFGLSGASLIGGLVFGSIGFVAFVYGKRLNLWRMMLCGLVLMIYPYFVENLPISFGIGIVGTLALFFLRD